MAEITYTLDLQNLNLENLSADQTLDALLDVRLALARLKATDEALLDRLDQLAASGEIDQGGFAHNDWAFSWSAGRRSWSYPPGIQALEAQTKAAKKAAQADGTATATLGDSFWTVTPPNKP
jgi:hypothetical protein